MAAMRYQTRRVIRPNVGRRGITTARLFSTPRLDGWCTELHCRRTAQFGFRFREITRVTNSLLAHNVPRAVVVFNVGHLFALLVEGEGPATHEGDLWVLARFSSLARRDAARLFRVNVVGTEAGIRIGTSRLRVVALCRIRYNKRVNMPSAILTIFTANVNFLTVSIAGPQVGTRPCPVP